MNVPTYVGFDLSSRQALGKCVMTRKAAGLHSRRRVHTVGHPSFNRRPTSRPESVSSRMHILGSSMAIWRDLSVALFLNPPRAPPEKPTLGPARPFSLSASICRSLDFFADQLEGNPPALISSLAGAPCAARFQRRGAQKSGHCWPDAGGPRQGTWNARKQDPAAARSSGSISSRSAPSSGWRNPRVTIVRPPRPDNNVGTTFDLPGPRSGPMIAWDLSGPPTLGGRTPLRIWLVLSSSFTWQVLMLSNGLSLFSSCRGGLRPPSLAVSAAQFGPGKCFRQRRARELRDPLGIGQGPRGQRAPEGRPTESSISTGWRRCRPIEAA